MNQILNIDFNKNVDNSNNSTNMNNLNDINLEKNLSKKVFNVQFFLSLFAIFITISIFLYYKISLNHRENFSNSLIDNYSISKLYSNYNNSISNSQLIYPDSIIGIIEIPSLELSYPIYNSLSDDLLKISPCRFYGNLPSEIVNSKLSNLCIAGHNYDNNKFFSKIKNLNIDDQIFIFDNFNNQFKYCVTKNYEVKSNDLSPVYTNFSNSFELTLVTCNNFNGNRIIIKAKIEDD